MIELGTFIKGCVAGPIFLNRWIDSSPKTNKSSPITANALFLSGLASASKKVSAVTFPASSTADQNIDSPSVVSQT